MMREGMVEIDLRRMCCGLTRDASWHLRFAKESQVVMLVRPEGVAAVLEARWLEPDWQVHEEILAPDTVRVVWRRKAYGTGPEPLSS